MEWDSYVPPADVSAFIASGNPDFSLNPSVSSDPYIVFNTISKNNNRALGTTVVRQALEYAINRQQLRNDAGGSQVAPALKQILPPGIAGSQPYANPYPHSSSKAKQLLTAAGYPSLTLTLLYTPSPEHVAMFATLQANLAKVGVTLKGLAVTNHNLYATYLQPGTAAKNSVWDLALVAARPTGTAIPRPASSSTCSTAGRRRPTPPMGLLQRPGREQPLRSGSRSHQRRAGEQPLAPGGHSGDE